MKKIWGYWRDQVVLVCLINYLWLHISTPQCGFRHSYFAPSAVITKFHITRIPCDINMNTERREVLDASDNKYWPRTVKATGDSSSHPKAYPFQVPHLRYHLMHSKNVYIPLNLPLSCKGMATAVIPMKGMSTFRCRYFKWVMKLNFLSVVSICWQGWQNFEWV